MNDVVKLDVIQTLTGPEACSTCKGQCCKQLPGFTKIERWLDEEGKLDRGAVKSALESGFWIAEDRLSPEKKGEVIFAIRPARVFEEQDFREGYLSGNPGLPPGLNCIFLTEKGCSLSNELRPHECLGLISKVKVYPSTMSVGGYEFKQECEYPNDGQAYSIFQLISFWEDFSDEIEEIRDEVYAERNIEKY